MARIIRRSGVVPLSLIIGTLAPMGTEKMALVVNNMDRLVSLDLHAPHGGGHRDFFESFNQPVPLLQHLAISNYEDSVFAFPPEFLGGSAPNLRHMKVTTSAYIPWDSGLLAHLISLDVTGSEEPGDVIPPPLEMLLSALAGMPELETLILRHCFHRRSPSETAAHTHVYLSNLKRMEVSAPLTRCTRFLRQITVNVGTIVLLDLGCSSISQEDVEEFFTVFPSHLYMTLTPVAQALKFTWRAYCDFKIDVWTVQQDTKVKNSQNTSIRLNFYWDSDRSRGISPLDLTWTCFTALASSQLRSFRISSEYLAGWDAGVWRNLARMVPDLRTLAPGERPQSVALCKALSPDWSDSMPVDCYLPALSYLEIDAPCDHPIPTPNGGESPLAAVLVHALAARASAGCSTPLLKLIPSWRDYPSSSWLKLIRDAVPGICVRVESREEEEFMG
ncbi:hypothetical protein BD779DRAFT_1039086 [Infundibulicybe gibba]|nr:hypothetical protein BD779DRAFT_1039086 [Infundibulicybe gibba]